MKRKDRLNVGLDRQRLQNPYAHLQPDGTMAAADNPRSATSAGRKPGLPLAHLKPIGPALSRREVAERARAHLIDRWKKLSAAINDKSERVRACIDPVAGARSIGLAVHFVPTLSDGANSKSGGRVAGQFDPVAGEIWIAEDHPAETRLFTAAHELGHAILHPDCTQHRDRAARFLEGSRSQVELEADWFATELLMPPKLVISAFEERFGLIASLDADHFRSQLNDSRYSSIQERREFSMALAATGRYGGRVFTPLHIEFSVSPFAMAIRLEELGFV